MSQKIENIAVKDLVLWTENPRDPIDSTASDQDIANRAVGEKKLKWNLEKLAASMGPEFDFSELPTVVFKNGKPVVYDGNRRMLLAKAKLGFVSLGGGKYKTANFPSSIPCNVCDEDTALNNIYRKHAESGSWDTLERDIFVAKHLKKGTSAFLALDEATNIISNNPHLNQLFVSQEVFKKENLDLLGIELKDGKILSKHSEEETKSILLDISNQVKSKNISTRNNRGKILEVLDDANKAIIAKNHKQRLSDKAVNFDKDEVHTPIGLKQPADALPTETSVETEINPSSSPRHSQRTKAPPVELFGGKLVLEIGNVNDLYRDIDALYAYYQKNKGTLSVRFPSLIRMALRLLCETAAEKSKKDLKGYLEANFATMKTNLSKDEATTLSAHSVSDKTLIQLLQIGAHNYSVTSNIEQTLAISLAVGRMLTQSHGKK